MSSQLKVSPPKTSQPKAKQPKYPEFDFDLDYPPLHTACLNQNKYQVKHFLLKGENPNEFAHGVTPLMCIAVTDPEPVGEEIIDILLNFGANPSLKSKEGYTAFEYASTCAYSNYLTSNINLRGLAWLVSQIDPTPLRVGCSFGKGHHSFKLFWNDVLVGFAEAKFKHSTSDFCVKTFECSSELTPFLLSNIHDILGQFTILSSPLNISFWESLGAQQIGTKRTSTILSLFECK